MVNSRRKGAQAERELINELRSRLNDNAAHRNLSQTRDGGMDLCGEILDLGKLAIEAKACKTARYPQWLEQARRQAGDEYTPVLAVRQWGGQWRLLVDFDLDSFCEFARERMNND